VKLSISAIRLSELEGARRVDAEFYQPHYLGMVKCLSRHPKLTEYKPTVIHPVEVKREYEDEGLQLLFAQNIKANRLDFSHVAFLPASLEPIIRKNKLQAGDVLVTRTGANYGDAACYLGKPSPLYASAHCLVIRASAVSGPYLATFFNTNTGRALLKRGAYGSSQPELAPDYIRSLHVPRNNTVEARVEAKLKATAKKMEEVDGLYAQIQRLMAGALGWDTVQLHDCKPTYIRSFSQVRGARRIDAEYFHSEKAKVQEWLAQFPGHSISTYFKSGRDLYTPPKHDTGKTILNFDLTDAMQYFVDETGPRSSECEIGSTKKKVARGDVIVSRLRSYLKEVALVAIPNGEHAVGSSEFIVLRALGQSVCPELLVAFVRSSPVQIILKWSQDGSNHPRFQEDELLAIKVPAKVITIQNDVRDLFQAGISASREARQMLVDAKAEVEQLIKG
jgi:type I restriction enzyme S subunit